ncbi:MAG: exo-alpha-sialidase [Breznakibacter sp.]
MKKHLFLTLAIAALPTGFRAQTPHAVIEGSGFVFEVKSTPACHAATLAETAPGRLMAAWFGGSYEGAKDVGIYTAGFRHGRWGNPVRTVEPKISGNDTLPCWNPVLFKSQRGTLYLFYKTGKNPREWTGAYICSHNKGKSWSKPIELPDGILGPIKNKPIEVCRGTILCPSSTESIVDDLWRAHVEIFDEATNTWHKVDVDHASGFDVIQPTLLAHSAQRIQMLCRSRHDKVIGAWSDDGGLTWGKLDSLNVPNSNSGIDGTALQTGGFLLVNNPLPKGPDWFYGRHVLDLEYSPDGIAWRKLLDLEHEGKGEFSYPAIIQTKHGKVHIVYTYNREKIKHVTVSVPPSH